MWNVRRSWRFVLCPLVCASFGLSQVASPPKILFVLTDGSQLTGTVASQDGNHIEVLTNSFRQSGEPPVSVILDPRNVASCSMIDLGIPPTTVGGHMCGAAISPIHTGLQQATLSLGYVGSAQRDESAKSTVTFAGYQKVSSTGSFRAQTKLFLNVSYDDKWKATPLSSNVTQFGIDVCVEALNLYQRRGRMQLDKLEHYAKLCRIERVMRPYIEAIL